MAPLTETNAKDEREGEPAMEASSTDGGRYYGVTALLLVLEFLLLAAALVVLDERVRRIGEDLGGTVAASHYRREGAPEKEIVRLGEEIDADLIVIGGRRQARLERVFGANLAEKVMRRVGRPVLILDDRSSGGPAVPR